MARLSRKLRVCKWVGTVACALLVAAFVFSGWRGVRWRLFHVQGVLYSTSVAEGCIALAKQADLKPGFPRVSPRLEIKKVSLQGWYSSNFRWLPSIWRFANLGVWVYLLPLWIPFILLLVPTLLLWRRDRRRPRPGFCRACDYDLTGNTSGRCSECGLEIAKPPTLSEPAPPG